MTSLSTLCWYLRTSRSKAALSPAGPARRAAGRSRPASSTGVLTGRKAAGDSPRRPRRSDRLAAPRKVRGTTAHFRGFGAPFANRSHRVRASGNARSGRRSNSQAHGAAPAAAPRADRRGAEQHRAAGDRQLSPSQPEPSATPAVGRELARERVAPSTSSHRPSARPAQR